MKTFHILWEIDIEAETAEEACRKALAIQRDPQSISTVFDVVSPGGGTERFDLEASFE
jgi:hypothetical protein